jgi:hypothetical protein
VEARRRRAGAVVVHPGHAATAPVRGLPKSGISPETATEKSKAVREKKPCIR